MWTSIQPNSIVIVAMKLFPCYLWLFSLFFITFSNWCCFGFSMKMKTQISCANFRIFMALWRSVNQCSSSNYIELHRLDHITSHTYSTHNYIIRQKQLTKSRLKVTPTTCFVVSVFVCILFWDEKKIHLYLLDKNRWHATATTKWWSLRLIYTNG